MVAKVHPVWKLGEAVPILSLLTAFVYGLLYCDFEGSVVKAGLCRKTPDERHLFTQLARTLPRINFLFFSCAFW